jgi:hypothetical protein
VPPNFRQYASVEYFTKVVLISIMGLTLWRELSCLPYET